MAICEDTLTMEHVRRGWDALVDKEKSRPMYKEYMDEFWKKVERSVIKRANEYNRLKKKDS